MFCVILLCCGLIGEDPTTTDSRQADLKVYESARAMAGENADAHARLALWCEAHGLSAERVKQLATAVKYDPTYPLARGLMGLVAYQGKWARPEVIGEQIQNDSVQQDVIREYLDRRVKADSTPAAQKALAEWCEQKGLKEQALAHFNNVIRLDPTREDVWRHLGYKQLGDRWLKAEEAEIAEKEGALQRQADKRWRIVLEKMRDDLESTYPAKRTSAEKRLTKVTDTRAVPMIWAVFVRGTEKQELDAVQMLGQIDSTSAANGLAAMAVFSPTEEVCERAKDALKHVDPRSVVENLIDLVHRPFAFQVRPGSGPGSPNELFVEGERYNVQRFYQTDKPRRWGGRLYSPPLSFDPFMSQNPPRSQSVSMRSGQMPANFASPDAFSTRSFPGTVQVPGVQQNLGLGLQIQNSRRNGRGLERGLIRDVGIIQATNAGISQLNSRSRAVLSAITGRDLGDDPEDWKSWWTDQLGYAYHSSQSQSKPTYTTFTVEPRPDLRYHSCFGAGTLVRTALCPTAIEKLQVGDRVLSQNTTTGSLEFQPVVAVYHNEPAATLRLAIGGEPIVATGIHRLWQAGKGWKMARELKAGDRLRTVGGVVEIQSVTEESVQPVFNLEVAGNRDYFVGKLGTLVHDYSFVQSVREPFDREPDLAALAPASH